MARVPFHQRLGGTPKPQVGLKEMPTELRAALWNTFQHWIFSSEVPGQDPSEQARNVYVYIGWLADEVCYYEHDNRKKLKAWFLETATWDRAYDFVEWLPRLIFMGPADRYDGVRLHRNLATRFIAQVNSALEREGAPYRYVNTELVPITDDNEIAEIEKASVSPFSGARQHIAQSTTLLALKPNPDYRNSIKESVSAIESLLKEATAMKSGDLGQLLTAFEKKHGVLHPAFRKAVSNLYGWTSDEGGVRHAIFAEVDVDHSDARFMLVACSAFVNFLIQHAAG